MSHADLMHVRVNHFNYKHVRNSSKSLTKCIMKLRKMWHKCQIYIMTSSGPETEFSLEKWSRNIKYVWLYCWRTLLLKSRFITGPSVLLIYTHHFSGCSKSHCRQLSEMTLHVKWKVWIWNDVFFYSTRPARNLWVNQM